MIISEQVLDELFLLRPTEYLNLNVECSFIVFQNSLSATVTLISLEIIVNSSFSKHSVSWDVWERVVKSKQVEKTKKKSCEVKKKGTEASKEKWKKCHQRSDLSKMFQCQTHSDQGKREGRGKMKNGNIKNR